MKKLFCAVLALTMLLAFCGCQQEPEDTRPTYDLTPPTEHEHAGDAKFWGDYEKSENLRLWYQVSGKDIYMDVPDWGNFQEHGDTDLFQNTELMIAITVSDYVNYETPETMRECLIQNLGSDTSKVLKLGLDNLLESETVTIHGIDFLKSVSKTQTGFGHIQELHSYSFVLDGIAINICGTITGFDYDPIAFEKVDGIILEMVRSVRTTYEWEAETNENKE